MNFSILLSAFALGVVLASSPGPVQAVLLASGLEAFVHQTDRHGTFARSRGQAPDRAAAHVAGGEDPGAAGLEEERRAAIAFRGGCGSRSGQDEAMVVEGDLAVQPAGSGLGADEDEEGAHVQRAAFAGGPLLDDDLLQRVAASE